MLIITHHNAKTLVAMPEKVVFANAEQLKVQLHNLIEQGSKEIILDLSEVTFVDSSGLAVFVAALKKARTRDASVVLVAPTDNVRMLIELTRLHQVFSIYDDLSSLQVSTGE